MGVRGGDVGGCGFSRDLGSSGSLGLSSSSHLYPALSSDGRNGMSFSCAGRITGLPHKFPCQLRCIIQG